MGEADFLVENLLDQLLLPVCVEREVSCCLYLTKHDVEDDAETPNVALLVALV